MKTYETSRACHKCSFLYFIIQNLVVNEDYILSKSDIKNGIVELERGKDKVILYPKTKEVEIFEYTKMRTV